MRLSLPIETPPKPTQQQMDSANLLENKAVVVTGGSRGIGRSIVLTLAAQGADVTFFYCSNEAAANETLAAAAGLSGTAKAAVNVKAKRVDVRNAESCEQAIDEIAEEAGKIDILVNSAGIIRDNILGLLTNEDIQEVLATNVVGVFNVLRPVIPYMVSKRRGKIINISSVAGEKGGRGQTNYAASKGAINALTKALAVELAPRNILVNCVAPGVIETEMTEAIRQQAGDVVKSRILLGRFGQPEDVANVVLFFASSLSDYVTGQVLHVDGGFKMS
jgi:3-oxoacyl-[acyl-carrier protein] reductase